MNYNELENLPTFNGIEVKGDLALTDIGILEMTPEEVKEHKGEEVTEENEKFDVDKDGDIDDDDVAKASEIEVS